MLFNTAVRMQLTNISGREPHVYAGPSLRDRLFANGHLARLSANAPSGGWPILLIGTSIKPGHKSESRGWVGLLLFIRWSPRSLAK